MPSCRRHGNRASTITGDEALTYQQVADILTRELGRTIRYAKPGIPACVRHTRKTLDMPWAMVAVTTAIYTTARLGRAADSLTADVHTVLDRAPIDFARFVQRESELWNPTMPKR